MITEGKLIFFQ